jgi:hypothetical protein
VLHSTVVANIGKEQNITGLFKELRVTVNHTSIMGLGQCHHERITMKPAQNKISKGPTVFHLTQIITREQYVYDPNYS